ncbi:hypothetical protein DFP74_6698 [Nocardiopsis sp. Huas11]|uniref:hypothetical protein n=1 Tax=Nocardiopsis sp. Huas11 TaxID=2183912 RepID=UPI000EAE28ED|nr:hypothetical protein [Nocardiopsis sp. Huas11]RKR98977.1 hypothetical protein DFP74_6698 [Nocardiopsis sp. Huas11]
MWTTFSVLGAIALGITIGMWIKKKFNRFMLACAVIAGFSVAYPIAEFGGPLLSQLDQVAPWVAVNLVLAALASVFLFFDFKEKGIKKHNIIIGFLAPVLFLLAAGPFLVPLDLVSGLGTGVESALSSMGR